MRRGLENAVGHVVFVKIAPHIAAAVEVLE
jgi:hypothetical protein